MSESTIKSVAHGQSAVMLDVLTLLEFAIGEANDCEFEEQQEDASGMTNRHSRFMALLCMTQEKLVSVINAFDPHI